MTANYIRIVGVAVEGAQGDGISIENAHHVEVRDGRFVDCGESGIQADYSDVLRLENNRCTGNAASGWFSGISLYQCRELTDDAPEGFRNIVRGNVCDRNFTYAGQHTDGNGIIIDDFRQTQAENEPVYPHSTLVEKNTCRENGGKGIQVVWSDHVTVLNNWCEGNGQDPLDEGTWRGELSNANSSDNTFIDNVAIADPSASPYNRAILNTSHGGYVNRNVVWTGNTTWNGTPGDPSVFVEGGGTGPDPAENALGVKPNREADPCDTSACATGAVSFCHAAFTPVSNAAYPDQSTDPVVEAVGCEVKLRGEHLAEDSVELPPDGPLRAHPGVS